MRPVNASSNKLIFARRLALASWARTPRVTQTVDQRPHCSAGASAQVIDDD